MKIIDHRLRRSRSAGVQPCHCGETPFNNTEPQFSPDGRWIAYKSSETGRTEVYVQPFPVTGAKWQISSTGGNQPMWRRDGQRFLVPMLLDTTVSSINVVLN